MEKRKRLIFSLACVLTFCFVSVVFGDAIVPLGFGLPAFLVDDTLSKGVRLLLLAPFVGLLTSAFIDHRLARSLLLGLSIAGLLGLWVFFLIAFVLFPVAEGYLMYIVPLATSIPFIWAVVVTATHAIKIILSEQTKSDAKA